MKKKLLYLSLILIVVSALNLKTVQATWYDYIDFSMFWGWIESYGIQDYFVNWLVDYGIGYYGGDIIWWLLSYY